MLLHVVIHRHGAVTNLDGPRHRPGLRHLIVADEIPSVDQQRHVPDALPVRRRPHLRCIPRGQLRLPQSRRYPAQATPHFADLLDDRLIAAHPRVPQRLTRGRLGQQMPSGLGMLGRKFVEPFTLARELEPEVRKPSAQQHRRLLAIGVECQLRWMALRILLDEFNRQLRAFDARPRDTEPVGEVAQRSRHRPPTAAHARLRHARLMPIRRLLLNHQIEGHEAGQQFAKAPVQLGADQR